MALIQDGEKYKIISVVNHCVLDILGGHPVNSTHLITYKWIEGAHQIWEAHEISEGTFLLASTAHGDKVGKIFAIDASGTDHGHPIVYGAHGQGNQLWIIEPIKPNAFVCYIKNKLSNKVLQSHGDRAEVTLETKDVNNPNQRWGLLELDSHPLPGRTNTENTPVKVEHEEPSPPPKENVSENNKAENSNSSDENEKTKESVEAPINNQSPPPPKQSDDDDSDKSGHHDAAESKPKKNKKKTPPPIKFGWEEV